MLSELRTYLGFILKNTCGPQDPHQVGVSAVPGRREAAAPLAGSPEAPAVSNFCQTPSAKTSTLAPMADFLSATPFIAISNE